MRAPIVVVIFNRPQHAKQLSSCLEHVNDRDLYVIVDGAGEARAGEAELVRESIRAFAGWQDNRMTL